MREQAVQRLQASFRLDTMLNLSGQNLGLGLGLGGFSVRSHAPADHKCHEHVCRVQTVFTSMRPLFDQEVQSG